MRIVRCLTVLQKYGKTLLYEKVGIENDESEG
jgi:hypothetical protein